MEKHRITGIDHYIENIELMAIPNPFYEDSKKEIIDNYMTEERIYEYTFEPHKIELRPEDDNSYDEKAVALYLNDLLVGYIKKGSCSHIRKLIKEDKIKKVEVNVYGGRYKVVYELIEDEDDIDVDYNNPKYELENGETPYKIDLFIYTDDDKEEPINSKIKEVKPEDIDKPLLNSEKDKTMPPKKNNNKIYLFIAIIFFVVLALILFLYSNSNQKMDDLTKALKNEYEISIEDTQVVLKKDLIYDEDIISDEISIYYGVNLLSYEYSFDYYINDEIFHYWRYLTLDNDEVRSYNEISTAGVSIDECSYENGLNTCEYTTNEMIEDMLGDFLNKYNISLPDLYKWADYYIQNN